jgi:peptidylprolyl isomerase
VIVITAIGAYIILNNIDAYTLKVIVEGSGSIVKSPDQANYVYNEVISLTASASDSWLFEGWSGDFSGLSNPASVVLDSNKTVTATFVEKTDTDPARVGLITTMGNILIELRNDMPITTGNFLTLVQQGIYDNTIFHRVVPDFMIQGGDPTGTGYGDPSIPNIQDEFTSNNQNNRGTIAMANAGPNTGSSQFFINVVNNNYLDTAHPVFGTVIEGMDVVDSISLVPVNSEKPVEDVIILKAEVQD